MNNNRGNNRRRGRGNNRPQGGGQQLNRIDSRARGNAPQLLEKYRKLAHDAHLNGDRVTAEYYLQFADHYFRVIADTRQRQEEARARREDRWQEPGESWRDESEEGGDFAIASDFPTFDQPVSYGRREREDRPRGPRPEAGRESGAREPAEREEEGAASQTEGEAAGEPNNIYEPAENPFVRGESRGPRTMRPRREGRDFGDNRGDNRGDGRRDSRRPRWEDREAPGNAGPASEHAEPATLPLPLPPAISTGRRSRSATAGSGEAEGGSESAGVAQGDLKPAPKRRTRRKPAGDAGDAAESAPESTGASAS